MGRLLLLFIAVPLVELVLLVEIGQRIGLLATVAIVILTGALGASLARRQGVTTLARLRTELDAGRLPAEAIVDGVLILLAAAVLVTPGVLTDVVGFLCLVPVCRRVLKVYLKRRFERIVRSGNIGVTVSFGAARGLDEDRPPKNVTPRDSFDSRS